jgi:hypothetical protein
MNSTMLEKSARTVLVAALLSAPVLIQAQVHRLQPATQNTPSNNRNTERRQTEVERPARAERPAPVERREPPARAERPSPPERREPPARAERPAPSERRETPAHAERPAPSERRETPAHAERPAPSERHQPPARTETPAPAHSSNPPSHTNADNFNRHTNGPSSNERQHEGAPVGHPSASSSGASANNPSGAMGRAVPNSGRAASEIRVRPAVLRDPVRGMTVSHGPAAVRTIETKRSDGSRVVSVGKQRGFLERAIPARPGYVARTYVAGGRSYARVYETHSFRGYVYSRYVPRVYYHPAFYGWAFNPWADPVYFAWGWDAAPWYGYYGRYFVPARVYSTPALWLTDYLLAENLKLAYENQQQTGGFAPEEGNGALSPEVKQLIAEQVKQELGAERAAASNTETGDVSAERSEVAPPALDPTRRVFVVSLGLDVATQGGQTCALTPGDIILRTEDSIGASGKVAVTVLATKPGDCAINAAAALDVATLQEMHNQFREHIDSGLSILAVNQGKAGLPAGPDSAPRLAPGGVMQPDSNVDSVLLDQQQAADKIEAEARRSSEVESQFK